MNKRIIRGISMLLALAMVLGFIPVLRTEANAVTVNQQNIADRADFFFNSTWVCQKDVQAWRDEFTFRKGETYHLPYGQPVNSGKFIGYGVELEEFLMAAADANSVFYSRQSEFNGWTSVYYATDCAAFVAMCWGTVRQDCSTLPYYSTYKGKPTESNVYSILQLGDALDSTSVGHVVLVSDLIYNEDGELVQIEITEQTPPQLKRTYFTPSELAAKYGEEFGIYRYEGSVPAVPEWGYTTECTNYAAHCTVEITKDTPIMSLPCTTATEADSAKLTTALKGQTYTATRLYSNTANELWYRIATSGNEVGYIEAANTKYLEMLLSDISLSDADYPNAHVRGKTFSLVGNIYSKYNQLVTATTYIYEGFGTDVSPKTGGTDYVTGNAYTLKNSQIDYSTSFGDLTAGNHTITIGTTYRNYYVADGKINENTGDLELAQEYFMVVSSSTNQNSCNHSYTQTVLSVGNCTQTGLSVFACSSCGKVYQQKDSSFGHTFGDWSTTAATCTQDGSQTRTCSKCGETETKVLSATGHQYSEEIFKGNCQECPRTVYTCSTCGSSYTVYPEEIMTDWQETLPDDVDSDTAESKTQYRYADLKEIVSAEKSLDGYVYLGETWENVTTETLDYVKQWSSGFDSENTLYTQYNKTPRSASEGESEKVTIDSDSVTGYLYYHWCYDGSYFSQSDKTNRYNIFHAYYSTTKPDTYRVDTSDWSYCTAHETCSNTDWFFVVEVNTQTVTVQQKMYRQGQWQDFGYWGDTPVQSSDTRKVETRTMYRYPDFNTLGHQYDTVETVPTCTEAGSTTYTCLTCGHSYRTETAALGHSYETVTVDPICTEDGRSVSTCTRCADTQEVALPALGHSYETVVEEGNCTEGGSVTATCKICGDTQVEILPADGHRYETTKVPATCTQDGSVSNICSVCGNAQVEVIPATGHQYDAVVTDPTCSQKGYTTYTCACGDTYTADETAPLEHTYQMETVDATCTTDGSLTAICALCGDTKIGIIPATGHSYENGTCVKCGEAEAVPVIRPTLTLKSPTLEFKDMICINAFYTAENTQNVVEMGMITYKQNVSTVSVETADLVIPGATYVESTGRYYSSSQGIHAKYLGDTVYLAIYAKLTDGSYAYSKLAPYSAVTYANSQLKNSTDTKLKQLVAAMLNYGAEAQLYFGHNTDTLANRNLSAEQKALPEAYRADMISAVGSPSILKQGGFINNSGFAGRKPAISFEGAFCINYFFTPKYTPDHGITLFYWNAADYNRAGVLTADNASGFLKLDGSGTGEYRGDIAGISAKNLSEAVYVAAVYESDGITWTSGVLGYSIGAYCSGQAAKGSEIAQLAIATAVYGYHAKQYFG